MAGREQKLYVRPASVRNRFCLSAQNRPLPDARNDDPAHERFMNEALRLAEASVQQGGGGPFGAVVAREGEIIGRGTNRVTPDGDPTAHAEIVAIRRACRALENFSLSGCALYASCEPCPMCLGAIYWARLDVLYYAATREDAARAGFDDAFIYEEIEQLPEQRRLRMERLPAEKSQRPFEAWEAHDERVAY
ncbi:MAG: tRNA-specific adenosine deaminase [Bacteroidetes bacterium QH_8_67_23]|nr:MAG: tRNA-specific adenosine deaminase [Bacteroidetes bacterium QH_8_67_23]